MLVTIIVLKVVPAFSDFYTSFGAELPFVTRVILAVSDFVRSQFLLSSIARGRRGHLAAWVRQPGQKARFDYLILRLPMLGPVARKFATSQMARTLATLLGGGLPLVNALDIAAKSIGNQFMASQLDVVSARVREGESFAAALEARRIFPEVAVKMAEVGESTGALQDMLNTVADFYDEEISTTMERFITLVEPVLLVFMGVVIAGLLLALYMPLFQLSSVLSQSANERTAHRPPLQRRCRSATSTTAPKSTTRAAWRIATGSSSSTWKRSESIRNCSGRFPPT